MLVVLEFLLEKGYSHGVNALIPAHKMCKTTQIGVGWGQTGDTRTALVRACLHLRVPMAESQDTSVLMRAADLVIQELIEVNGGGASS